MLEQLLIFTGGGLILWTCKELGNAVTGSPIDALIWSCLVNGGASSIENGSSDVGAFDKAETLVSKGSKADPKKKITRKNRVRDDSPPQAKLDFTYDVGENGDNIEVVAVDHGESMMDKEEFFSSESEAEDDEEVGKDSKPETKKKGIAGKANLEKSDLEPALKAFKDGLMMKNVAEEIAEKLCESVAASLEGKKLASIVQAAIEEALVRILTPSVLEHRKPYVVVFVSVNGVGKSTDLAKVAYWLLQHEINVMMAACDTFRSGVVEQLRTHACRYRAYLLIYLKNSDLVLFVGEALVGNEAVDQLSKFNLKLAGLSTSAWPRLIDGILLTKFDTIDDKVGAALSMVYISGAPVMFVGYVLSRTDLKKLNVKSIVKTLLK
ncbi:hypothetical protein I3760_Q019100 [Carya illinoinensis]|nr:hypothetical protein I3760_Q019100 [Carya illinoinensis]